MAFPQVEGTSTDTAVASGSSNYDLPANIQAGETLIAIVSGRCAAPNFTWGTGWNELVDVDRDDQACLSVAWKKAVGEETTVSISSSAATAFSFCCYRISGAADPSVSAPEANSAIGENGSANPPSLTASLGSAEILWIASMCVQGDTTGPPTWPYADNRISQVNGTTIMAAMCSDEIEAETEDPDTFSGHDYDEWVAATICVYPEAAATGTNTQINIGDDWKSIAGAQINIGDDWKAVAAMWVNDGDSWKSIF